MVWLSNSGGSSGQGNGRWSTQGSSGPTPSLKLPTLITELVRPESVKRNRLYVVWHFFRKIKTQAAASPAPKT